MPISEAEECELAWQAAEEALRVAQRLPCGPERIAALRKAGQMRFHASEQKRATQQSKGRNARA
jgi:hypothetical protein